MRHDDVRIEIQPDQMDHSYIHHDVGRLSHFVDNAVVYIAGYVARALSDKIVCLPCKTALVSDSVSFVTSPEHSLIERKNRGGLTTPSHDVITMCKAAESIFRRNMGVGCRPPSQDDVKNHLVVNILSEVIGEHVFSCLIDHTLETEIFNDHRIMLMKKVAMQYVTVRLYHQGRVFTRFSQGESVRSVLCKTVLFKGQ
jgi:hypothetical protein